jgi:hypothetical protein
MKPALKPILKKGLLALVAAGLVASVVAGRERPSRSVIEPAARVDTRVRVGDDLDVAKLERAEDPGATNDLFARRNFEAANGGHKPGEKQAKAAPPPKPEAPPLPFQYFGKLTENGKTEVYVMRGEELISIARGETIGAEYRVDQVTDSSISFTYLPLKMKQTMDLPVPNS